MTTSTEVGPPLEEAEARDLTDRIRSTAEDLWALLLEAHDRRAWRVLGYGTWAEYVHTEFGMSRSRSYEVLDQGKVIRAIEGASDVRVPGQGITAEAARDLKPELPEVADRVKREVNGHREQHPDAPDDDVQQVVRRAVDEERDRIRKQREDREAIDALNAKAPDGFDPDADRAAIHARSKLYRAVEALNDLPDPEAMAESIPEWEAHNLAGVADACGWLATFADRWETP